MTQSAAQCDGKVALTWCDAVMILARSKIAREPHAISLPDL